VDTDATVRWAVRLAWVALPFAAGEAFADALDGASTPVRTVASAGLWAGWALGALAVAAWRPVGLTALRILAPAAAAATVAAAAGGHATPAGLAVAGALAVASLSAEVATAFANGAAYPNERRFPLRAPAVVSLLLGPLAWAIAVAGATAGPLLLAARQWAAGAAATAVGLPAAFAAARALHLLSRRWAVLVPAGLVLHDPMTLREPVLFHRRVIEVLRPAPVGTAALDLTAGAPGLALELVCREKVPMCRVLPGRRRFEEGSSALLMFTPARPGALLRAAAARRINVADPADVR
jgi:hypothetical protein